MLRPARGLFLAAGILGSALLGGCGGSGAEVSIPQVEVIEQPQISQTEEQREAQLDPESEAGTVLGEEEVIVMSPEGEPQTALYTRIRGNGDFSIAYDAARFLLSASDRELRFEPAEEAAGQDSEAASEEAPESFLSIRTEEAPSAEELADQYVADSGEECSVEEVSIGEGEYPALWVSYAEGTEPDSRSCSLYVFRYNSVLYVAQLDGMVGDTQLAGELNTILSTLRFDEG